MTTTFVGFQQVTRNFDRIVSSTAERPEVERAIDYWRENIGNVTTVDDFLDDSRLYRFAMEAFGLQDQIFARGLMRKIMEEGVSDPRSQANRMTDRRFREFAEVFDFSGDRPLSTQDPQRMEQVAARFVNNEIEVSEGERNPGVRLALYFERRAPELNNHTEILADRALSEVVRTVLRLPQQIATLDIDRYTALLEERVDLNDFKDPAKLDSFLKRFSLLYDLDNPALNAAADARLQLTQPVNLLGRPPVIGLSADVILSLAQISRA